MKRIFYIIIAMVLVALIATSAYFVLSHHFEAKRATDLYKKIADIAEKDTEPTDDILYKGKEYYKRLLEDYNKRVLSVNNFLTCVSRF